MHLIEIAHTPTQLIVNSYIRAVCNWLALGLLLSGIAAHYVWSNTILLRFIQGHSLILALLILSEVVVLFTLMARVQKLRLSAAAASLVLFAILNGVTFATLLMVFSRTSIAPAFIVAAGTFAACSIYSLRTHQDLTSWGSFGAMGLIGIIIASLANLTIGKFEISTIINYAGVILFVALTVYDTKKIAKLALSQSNDLETASGRRHALTGALILYIDFVSLFVLLVYLVAGNRD